ncbi:MAG: phosphoglycerate dehydrogenase [Chitinophagales bacterium]
MSILTSYPKEKINVLLLENISDNAVEGFKKAGYLNIKKLKTALPESELMDEIKNIHLLGLRSKTQLSQAVLNAAEKLLAAGCYCIGTNQVDINAATEKGVVIFNAPYSNTRSVAELVIGSAIMLIRRIPEKNNSAHHGIWLKDAAGSYELRGKKLGLVGYGNIGSQVSILAEALGMEVIYYDVEPKLPLGNAKPVRTLKELLNAAQIISLHIPENNGSQYLIGASEIAEMQQGSILINYARGKLIDLVALKSAVENKKLAGAAIDVFPDEPEKNGADFFSVLQNLPNVLLTPHIGGSTEEAQLNISEDVTHKLLNYLEKGITTGSHSIPALNLPVQENTRRILHIHKNIPGVLSAITTILSGNSINILGQYLKTNDLIGYAVLDVDTQMDTDTFTQLKSVDGTIKARMVY